MTSRLILIIASISGFLCVALGAFGAHALKELLISHGRTETFELAVRYQFYHTLVLLFIGLSGNTRQGLTAWFFISGIILFSGSLYFLAVVNSTALMLVTPIGGVMLLLGWARMIWVFAADRK